MRRQLSRDPVAPVADGSGGRERRGHEQRISGRVALFWRRAKQVLKAKVDNELRLRLRRQTRFS